MSYLIRRISVNWHSVLVKCKYYEFRSFFINLPFFIVQAWKWRWFDHHYSLNLYCESLERMGRDIKKHGHSTSSDKSYRECLTAARQLRDAYNYSVCDDKSYMKWAENNPVFFSPVGDNGYGRIGRKYYISEEYSDKMYKVISNRIEKTKAQRKEFAWGFIHKKCERWWD